MVADATVWLAYDSNADLIADAIDNNLLQMKLAAVAFDVVIGVALILVYCVSWPQPLPTATTG